MVGADMPPHSILSIENPAWVCAVWTDVLTAARVCAVWTDVLTAAVKQSSSANPLVLLYIILCIVM